MNIFPFKNFAVSAFLLTLGLSAVAQEVSEIEYQAKLSSGLDERIKHWEQEFVKLNLLSQNAERINQLGRILRGIGDLEIYKYHKEEAANIKRQAWEMMREMPGHAEYYAKLIELERGKAVSENAERAKQGIPAYWSRYNSARHEYFQTLQQMPSSETIKILGKLLFDTRDYLPPGERDIELPQNSNAELAVKALSKFNFSSAPKNVGVGGVDLNDIEIWQNWHKQVEAGIRTFRFEGNPQEYNFQGPVSVAKAPVTDRPDKRPAAVEPTAEKEVSGRLPIPALLAAALAVLTAGWYFLRARRKGTA